MSINSHSPLSRSFPAKKCQERRKLDSQSGLTLIELLIFIVVVSVGVVGILSVMNQTTRYSSDPMVRKQAIAVAESLLEEILVKDFSDPDGVAATEASRDLYDDVDDYSGFSASPVKDINGSVLLDGAGNPLNFTASVSVTAQAFDVVPGADAKLITVSVSGRGETITLSAYKVNY
ncbi:MAG: prepilin-type N-terminal cleavage/methylation domain-containing protein [Sulfurimicrobium sp.]|nr:prepilin-type N-terminal cleavage/methylation domain-containing protein [Sulfurimicrobium sp.]MDP1703403.1 prepilin-type N-terminal cleavage/methylation domain-containing protein [Sulfurimicrobium sp.]MDP2198380.1 prepilin-type N-terminal cleavage/methylation domain-containing protein [Sulfurimicrobium sp.]MDP2961800.1 prepilin-type N-terminal cleavage/methylation domain-containing protein [Sulfurimicrobium sp.]MDP3686924.1 prepilin-type N-terminal cleavage/methylation domain-containing prot